MRHFYNFVFAVVLVFALCGCSKPEPIVVRSLTLSSNAVAFDCDGGTKGLAVKPYPADMEWVVECDVETEPWFEVDVVSGGVEVVARPNLTTSERVGSFNIVAKGENLNLEPYQVSVCQEAGRAIDLSISAPQSCTLDSEGDSYTFTVIAPTQWSVTSSAPWLEVVVDGSLVTFRTQANPDAEPRVGVVTVSYDKSSFTVTITQKLSEAPTNEQITAAYLQGKYYGVQQGLYNYYLAFSDLGLDSNDKYSVPNAHYYFVDLYLDVEPTDMTNIVVPNGVYEFDITNSGFANTFTDSFSWYQINNEQGYALPENQIHFEVGKLTVEDGKVTLEVRMQINYMQKTHVVTYEGAYSLIDCTNESY